MINEKIEDVIYTLNKCKSNQCKENKYNNKFLLQAKLLLDSIIIKRKVSYSDVGKMSRVQAEKFIINEKRK